MSARIGSAELEATKARLGFPIFETDSREGRFVLVAPWNEQAARAELRRLGLLSVDDPSRGNKVVARVMNDAAMPGVSVAAT